jgi:hypothetical protein
MLLIITPMQAQARFDSGPYKGFVREEPELNTVELPVPLTVSEVRGRITALGGQPLADAWVEIRDSAGRVTSAMTNNAGDFILLHVVGGTYRLKVSKNQFQSTVGIVVVSRKFSRAKRICVQLGAGT